MEVLNNALSKFVPRGEMSTRQKHIWWKRGIEYVRKVKQKMWNVYKNTKNSYANYNYKMVINKATRRHGVQKEIFR